ncbi:MAG: acylneuraminate cytidylyltransferase family protein [Deltaproteobacteria bacterium]|jgi:N-acylneuraminate cytidylyltransferase|nr:acylneuraminate cytidylyltransferase family protein [Deltaproteobacteria bacterium]
MILGVIPARGGSKGIPRKNIKPVCGHPLIAWTIQAAAASRLLTAYAVSTEDDEIASLAARYGAPVLERPAVLAEDAAVSREVVVHALRILGGDAAVLLQPTSPVRRPGLIDRVISMFGSGGWDSVATGFETLSYPPHGIEHRRQDIRKVFVNDGSVIVTRAEILYNESLFGEKAGTFVTSREENVDIDEEFDFWLAGKVLEKAMEEGWMTPPRPVR